MSTATEKTSSPKTKPAPVPESTENATTKKDAPPAPYNLPLTKTRARIMVAMMNPVEINRHTLFFCRDENGEAMSEWQVILEIIGIYKDMEEFVSDELGRITANKLLGSNVKTR